MPVDPPDAGDTHAFGITIRGARLDGLHSGASESAQRRTALTLVEPGEIDGAWPTTGCTRIADNRYPDGRLFMAIDRHPRAGTRVEAPEYGLHHVTPDGERWDAWLVPGPRWRWQRLVFAQVLPMIAALQGVAMFHASAVAIEDRVYGLLASSGTGKSSIATHLIAAGATFFTDDVLALEVLDGTVIAHPGPQFANVHAHELQTLEPKARDRLGTSLGSSDKHHLQAHGCASPLALGGLVFLDRGRDRRGVELDEVSDAARQLLSGAFVSHVDSPARLLSQIDVCAAIASGVRLCHAGMGADVTAAGAAARLRAWASD